VLNTVSMEEAVEQAERDGAVWDQAADAAAAEGASVVEGVSESADDF